MPSKVSISQVSARAYFSYMSAPCTEIRQTMGILSRGSMYEFKNIDIIFVLMVLILAPLISLLFQAPFLLSIFLFYVSLSIYFSFRTPKAIKKSLAISFVSIPICLFLDYMAFYNNAWAVSTIFPFRVLGLVPLEDFICLFFVVYGLTIIRQHFFETFHGVNYQRYRIFWVATILVTSLFLFIRALHPNYLKIPYYYFWLLIIVFILPTTIGLIKFKKFRRIIPRMLPFFFIGMISWELVALYLGQWTFPSLEYVGFVKFLGIRWPIEEFLVWQVLALPAILVIAEFGVGK